MHCKNFKMIEFNFFDSSSKYGVVKATVHKTGKLGFSSGAIKYMKLDEINYFKIATNNSDSLDKALYLIPSNNDDNDDKLFKVVKAGDYFYVFIKNVLREMDLDYKNENIIYDIEKMENMGISFFKLERREKK